MKTDISLLPMIAVFASALPVTTQEATQVYDPNADWSQTQRPESEMELQSPESTT
jgi:hypothetical protein